MKLVFYCGVTCGLLLGFFSPQVEFVNVGFFFTVIYSKVNRDKATLSTEAQISKKTICGFYRQLRPS